MPDNINNDYNELAKLIYPSIEASGNVYYGQTRKLAIDELFNINDGGFESNIKPLESRQIVMKMGLNILVTSVGNLGH